MNQSTAANRKPTELDVFVGEWRAEGSSFGGIGQTDDDPKAHVVPWNSSHRGYWHTGGFFLIEDEKARPGGDIFDTLSIKGFDTKTEGFFARTFENHGFYRNYALTKDNDLWTLTGKTERATISFSDKNRKQTIIWEWKPSDRWLPLCDRTAVRLD